MTISQERVSQQHLVGLAQNIHSLVLADLPDDETERRERLHANALAELVSCHAPLCTAVERRALAAMVHDLLHGFGVIAPLLQRADVAEIMINGAGPIWIERNGELERTDVVVDGPTLDGIVERFVANLGLRLDRLVPWVDTRLADGSRVHIAIPPMTVDGPCVTIRRHRSQPFTVADFGRRAVTDIVRQAILDRQTILVVGGTGSGKTSLLNALAALLPPMARIVTIEDAAELRLPGEHVVRLEARPASSEGVGELTIRTLVRNALRMRPDRIVVGEVRGAEAFDLIQALNTGHAGSLSTMHANGPADALRRLVALTMLADVGVSSELMTEQARAAIDVIVHVVRAPHGKRRIDAVLELGTEDRWLVRDGAPTNG